MRFLKIIPIVGFALAVSLGPAAAKTGAVGTACKSDIAKFCAGKKKGETRACLETNKAQVSSACSKALETHQVSKHKTKKKQVSTKKHETKKKPESESKPETQPNESGE